jgi:serine/arginine repetitive matrix protein 2
LYVYTLIKERRTADNQNHAYIEHGDISKLGESANPTSSHRRSLHSARLDKLDATRREDKTELLYEAELEIVSTRRSRSRSMSRFRGISEAATELPLPGAWNGTPKRKRSALANPPLQVEQTPTWGVSQWKELEKVFRAEREIWVTERSVKAMPGGFIGWARMSTFGPPAAVAKAWDPTRVVDRFLEEQGVKVDEQVGDWIR